MKAIGRCRLPYRPHPEVTIDVDVVVVGEG
jgi:ribosomal protein L9